MKKPEELKGLITSDDILGKDVIDSRGRYIGVLNVLHIRKDDKTITGISIDTGFMRPTVYVGINMVRNFGIDAVYIDYTPGSRYLGLKVFDRTGVYVGIVKNAIYSNNSVSEILLRVGLYKVKLSVNHVKVLGCNIILDISRAQVRQFRDTMKQKLHRFFHKG